MSRRWSGGLFAPTILCIFVERLPILVPTICRKRVVATFLPPGGTGSTHSRQAKYTPQRTEILPEKFRRPQSDQISRLCVAKISSDRDEHCAECGNAAAVRMPSGQFVRDRRQWCKSSG